MSVLELVSLYLWTDLINDFALIGYMFTVEDSSSVIWLSFAHQGRFIHSPKPEKALFVERDFLVKETTLTRFLHRIQHCASTGELESVANEIKVGA